MNSPQKLLMPRAVAVWLVDKTSLSFEQIADFCKLHALEVEGIADGEVARNVRGLDPVAAGQLAREEIERCQQDPAARMVMPVERRQDPTPKGKRRVARYTPIAMRRARPDAIAWILRHHPEMTDAQITRLVGTTRTTILSVRDRTHWNASNIKPVDPVSMGLCRQSALDDAVRTAHERTQKQEATRAAEAAKAAEDAA